MMEMRQRSGPDLAVKRQLHDDGCSAEDLRKWVAAVAFGRAVRVDPGGGQQAERREFRRPAFDVCARTVFFTKLFSQRYRGVAQIFREISDLPGSQWRVVGAGCRARGAQGIGTAANLVELLGGMEKGRKREAA